MILRRVWDDVLKNHVEKFKQDFPELAPLYANKEITLPNGSKIIFMAAETEADVERKFFGPEYMDIFVDQAEQFSEKELRLIKMAARWPGMGENACKLGLFYNPGGVSMSFLKRIFHDKKYTSEENPEDFAFIQAYGWDNVEWVRPALQADGFTVEDFYSWEPDRRFHYFITRSQYGRELNAQPPHIRIGHLLGRFDRFAGQYFGAVYDRDKISIRNDQLARLMKPYWRRWISIDWGFHHYAGVLWHARGKVTREELEKACRLKSEKAVIDVVVTYRTRMVQEVGEEELAMEIVKASPAEERKAIRHVFIGPIGPERKKKIGKHTVPQQLGKVLREHGMPEPVVADDARVDGWRLMYNQMKETFDCALVN